MPRNPSSRTGPEVACPHCGTTVIWNESAKWRPFCSQRCRMVDLGEWINEEKAIPGDEAAPDPPESDDF